MILSIALFLVFVSSVSSTCDNNCSGHGTCMVDEVCSCYDNWGVGINHDSGDCSDRICPFELAWVDTPDSQGNFHKYAECAGRGICNRATGECGCFDGYEGKSCQRTTCPNDCSGHGTCEYIEDMTYAADWNNNALEKFTGGELTYDYNNWDTRKTRGCVCDATYGDIDCSKRMCPHGNDVLDIRDDLLTSQKYQVQELNFQASDMADELNSKTFALTFTSRLNETFTTIPIVFDQSDMTDLINDIHLALLNLPNRVIDGLTVTGQQPNRELVTIQITFTGEAVQGPQSLITVEDYECGAGCTPKLDGLELQTRVGMQASNTTELSLADYNSYECGRRGKCDYSSGLCQCFTGYTGDNCNSLTTLS
eukprot:CAMPEP_0181308110 /NCGR_PEP_ID=MMETSP1101-20121128/11271_1 /TAXON_ID=46948 /ORGANISM="Rhodomonas abbreviata, Strain Caron Lab Isolate" /LENGTH=365 /DNA_ID=CAMNT_0023414437 /DNA_START=37 /DNA_END=1134 /DNA_ORIENTATION=-